MAVDVEERLRHIEDRLELQELCARYARALDDRDIPELMSLFCIDATFAHGDGRVAAQGTLEIERLYRSILSGYSFSIHIPQTHVIERLDAEEATGWVVGHAEVAEGGRYGVVAMRYQDEYRRLPTGWRFAKRTNCFYYFSEWSELGALGRTTKRVTFRGGPRAADLPEPLSSYQRFHIEQPAR